MRKIGVVDVIAVSLLWCGLFPTSDAFLSSTTTRCCRQNLRIIPFASFDINQGKQSTDQTDESIDDEELLRQVPVSQLVELCRQNQLPTEGSPQQLLQRLRDFADDQATLERRRLEERVARVQDGGSENSKEKYEIVSDDADDDDEDEALDDGYFYFALPNQANATEPDAIISSKSKKPAFISNSALTAPPPPDIEPDENGERVVTVFSSTDLNDLTGISNAQPGQSALNSQGMMATTSNEGAPWDLKTSQQRSESTSKELEEANDLLAELVQALLSLSGAPGFREEFTEGLSPLKGKGRSRSSFSPEGFVGFDPKKVSTETLTAASPALRIGRGQVLQEVLREFELRAIGYDGMAGDDVEKGGGHYREVSKVRAFLEGYRRAELRRVARETLTMLLDKLVSEGVDGLDLTLASMTRSSDDNGGVGELNDSLLDFLNDAIRQQKQKVEMAAKKKKPDDRLNDDVYDTVDGVWNVTTEDGMRVETLDPQNPDVQRILESEHLKSEEADLVEKISIPDSAPGKLLLLLDLLRDRLKAEAAFTRDEKGRNLRVLAYCLRVATSAERRALIKRDLGTSVDRLDSFSELVASSIEYIESTSYQLQPSKSTLNLKTLRSILQLVADMKQQETRKASGAKTNNSL